MQNIYRNIINRNDLWFEQIMKKMLKIYCITIKCFIFVITSFLIFLFNFILSKMYFYIIIRKKDYLIIIKKNYLQKDWKTLKIVEGNIWIIRFIKNDFFFNLFHCHNFSNMLQNDIFDYFDITYNVLYQYILQSMNSSIYFVKKMAFKKQKKVEKYKFTII